MTTLPNKGDRIRFIAHNPPDPDPLTYGEIGTVILANDLNIAVDWDSGRGLSLAPTDRWELVSLWCKTCGGPCVW